MNDEVTITRLIPADHPDQATHYVPVTLDGDLKHGVYPFVVLDKPLANGVSIMRYDLWANFTFSSRKNVDGLIPIPSGCIVMKYWDKKDHTASYALSDAEHKETNQ